MPRNMSFRMTTDQIRRQTKSITRRMGWGAVKTGQLIQPVVQGMGLPRGAKVERIGFPIKVLIVRRERLNLITEADVICEGYPDMEPADFVTKFCQANKGCQPDSYITRIGFLYHVPRIGQTVERFPGIRDDFVVGGFVNRKMGIKISDVRQEPLQAVTRAEIALMACPQEDWFEFVPHFCKKHKCEADSIVTRIEFKDE